MAYKELYEFEKALEHMNRDLSFCREKKMNLRSGHSTLERQNALIEEGQSHQNIGTVYQRMAKYDEAKRSYNAARQCFKHAGASSESRIADIDNNLKNCEYGAGVLKKIKGRKNQYAKLSSSSSTNLNQQRGEKMEILSEIARCYDDIQMPHKAIAYWERIIAMSENDGNARLGLAKSLYERYSSVESETHLKQSIHHATKAAQIIRKKSSLESGSPNTADIATCFDLIGNAMSAMYMPTHDTIEHYEQALAGTIKLLSSNVDYHFCYTDLHFLCLRYFLMYTYLF